jgi:hypothetical protein
MPECRECENRPDGVPWGMVPFYEDEPYGDTYVPILKGYDPCTCWRGILAPRLEALRMAVRYPRSFLGYQMRRINPFSKPDTIPFEDEVPF